mmetsp:Transcript_18244/g.32251  ORF Transcript_18244/g.32251 Transcript_18244/m.32251 type:complete len:223 (-) Transcript_18244:367-1035(-)
MKFMQMLKCGEKKTPKPVRAHNFVEVRPRPRLTKRALRPKTILEEVALPKGEDLHEWIAANTVDFYNEISLLYGLVVDDAQRDFKNPGEGFPPGFEYRWAESNSREVIRVSSPEYVDYVMTWVEDQLDNESIFPTLESEPFPDDFINYARDIYKRMFRVFAIMYHQHFKSFEEIEAQAHLNTCFKHFLFFVLQYDLVPPSKELVALKGPVDRLKADFAKQQE